MQFILNATLFAVIALFATAFMLDTILGLQHAWELTTTPASIEQPTVTAITTTVEPDIWDIEVEMIMLTPAIEHIFKYQLALPPAKEQEPITISKVKPISKMIKSELLEELGVSGEWTVKDLRKMLERQRRLVQM